MFLVPFNPIILPKHDHLSSNYFHGPRRKAVDGLILVNGDYNAYINGSFAEPCVVFPLKVLFPWSGLPSWANRAMSSDSIQGGYEVHIQKFTLSMPQQVKTLCWVIYLPRAQICSQNKMYRVICKPPNGILYIILIRLENFTKARNSHL